MDKYQEMAIKVYHRDATMAAKETAYELLINAGWSKEDIEHCQTEEDLAKFTIFLA